MPEIRARAKPKFQDCSGLRFDGSQSPCVGFGAPATYCEMADS